MSREFNGTSDYARSTTVEVTAFPFTMMAWVNPDVVNTEQYVCCFNLDSTTSDYAVLGWNSSGQVRAQIRNSVPSEGTSVNTSSSLSAGSWQFIAAEFGGSGTTPGTVKAVIGTNVDAGAAIPAGTYISTWTRTALGCRNGSTRSNYFDGHLAYVAVISGIPSAQDYTDLQTKAPHLVFASNRLVYYRLTTGDATDWNDEWDADTGTDFGTISGTTATNGVGDNPTLTEAALYLKLLVDAGTDKIYMTYAPT